MVEIRMRDTLIWRHGRSSWRDRGRDCARRCYLSSSHDRGIAVLQSLLREIVCERLAMSIYHTTASCLLYLGRASSVSFSIYHKVQRFSFVCARSHHPRVPDYLELATDLYVILGKVIENESSGRTRSRSSQSLQGRNHGREQHYHA